MLMEFLVSLIKEECQMSRLGGRVHVCPDMTTCLVYDVFLFPNSLIDRLKGMHAEISVVSDDESLSGFQVRIQTKRNNFTKVVITGTMLACMGAVVAHCLQYHI